MRTLLFFCFYILSFQLYAVDLELTQGQSKALPIAIVPFKTDRQDNYALMFSTVIKNDLNNSGRFSTPKFDLSHHNPSNVFDINFKYWRDLGVNNVIVGKVLSASNGQLYVSLQLLDPINQSHVLLNKDYQINKIDARSLAHHLSDLIFKKLTGEQGIFSTQIAYITVKDKRTKHPSYTLNIADQDGHSSKVLLSSSQPLMSPAWSPDGKSLAYVSFENKRAEIYLINVATGHREVISSFSGINGAPAWSPDGNSLAIVLSKSGSPKLYLYSLKTKKITQLTQGPAIDTEPAFSPDGTSLVFTSSRGGSPQLYRYSFANKKISRLTFNGNYNAQGSMTPDQKDLIMLHRLQSKFIVGIMSLVSKQFMPLTFKGTDESPSLAPNGKMLIYATKHQGKGVLRIVSVDGQTRYRLPLSGGDAQEPAWSPYLS